jgi:hypothetical protein
VETHDEIALIVELGCSHIQGYVYGKPTCAAEVRERLALAGDMATACGFRSSRSPRTSLLRKARIRAGDVYGDVRIRNISSGGAMIDGIDVEDDAGALDVMIELLEGQMLPARLRWAADGKAGLEFLEAFDLDRLAAATPAIPARKAG